MSSRARDLECMVTGLRMMRPSATSFRIVWRELALEISLVSLGSSQILRFPQPTTDAARRFWVVRLTLSWEMRVSTLTKYRWRIASNSTGETQPFLIRRHQIIFVGDRDSVCLHLDGFLESSLMGCRGLSMSGLGSGVGLEISFLAPSETRKNYYGGRH